MLGLRFRLMSNPLSADSSFFAEVDTIPHLGPDTDETLAFRWYDADRVVGDKTMAEHLRFAVCYWHSFAANGLDIFGAGTLDRPWAEGSATYDPSLDATSPDGMAAAEMKQDAAFEFMAKLGVPYFCFHDVDMAPFTGDYAADARALAQMVDRAGEKMDETGLKLLWGTANLFSHPRYLSGAATNPDPEMFARAAAQVCDVLEATHRLDGENYVLWGGREGYETLLNTDLTRETDQLARFMHLVVEHKHRIGFTGTILIEPKPFEPTKHQYDYDSATCHAFLQKYDLVDEIKLNIEVNHATLAGHDFNHEVAYAAANGILGSIDANAGDDRLGWDVDRFPVSVEQMTLGMIEILRAGGLGTGGLNFDAKLRRPSIARDDLFHAHIGGMDTMARALLAAHSVLESGDLDDRRTERYAGWEGDLGRQIMDGSLDLPALRERAATVDDPAPVSGRQEMLENIVARHIERAM